MRDRMRMDRLSVLLDDLILKILSFIGLKDAIQTSVLSSRWRFMWTSVPHLSFSSDDFSTMDNFSDSVTHVLSRRNNQLHLSSFSLYFMVSESQTYHSQYWFWLRLHYTHANTTVFIFNNIESLYCYII
ncbi:putative F-box-like domain superfamily protein [Helianthus annuus]|nr:putative F-box-like domain superfamily protein [Helianthus annuus]